MDSSIQPLRHKDFFLVSTTDFFYPLIDDPYMMGKIGCANVLSDLYALGVTECDNMLMLLATSTDMEENLRHIVTKQVIKGFNETAALGGTEVTGGQTVQNPWPIIGGVAMAVCKSSEIILPENAKEGHVLVLTKALGTQIAGNAHQWLVKGMPRWDSVKHIITPEEVDFAYQYAMKSMSRLNRNAARLMHKHKVAAATDVTGFGILGHANNLAQNQKAPVDFIIDVLPFIKKMKDVGEIATFFNLLKGQSAETSGGLLMAMDPLDAKAYCEEIQQIDGYPAWVVGRVVKRSGAVNQAFISDNPTYLSIPE